MASNQTYSRPSTSRNTHKPIIAAPLSYSTTPDTVTNPDRAKYPEITRVLSPLRARKTPVLVNAPDVRWRLAHSSSLLRGTASLDSVVSSGSSCSAASTTSEVSTVRPYTIAPRETTLPISSANSIATAIQDGEVSIPLDPADTSLGGNYLTDEEIEVHEETGLWDEEVHRKGTATTPASWVGEEYVFRSHPLSPVLEVRSTTTASAHPSIRSLEEAFSASMDDDGSAQDYSITDPRRAGIYIHRDNNLLLGNNSLSNGTVDAEKEVLLASEEQGAQKGKKGLCRHVVKVKRNVQQFGAKIVRGATTRVVVWVLARAF